jgi:hypothetical protein
MVLQNDDGDLNEVVFEPVSSDESYDEEDDDTDERMSSRPRPAPRVGRKRAEEKQMKEYDDMIGGVDTRKSCKDVIDNDLRQVSRQLISGEIRCWAEFLKAWDGAIEMTRRAMLDASGSDGEESKRLMRLHANLIEKKGRLAMLNMEKSDRMDWVGQKRYIQTVLNWDKTEFNIDAKTFKQDAKTFDMLYKLFPSSSRRQSDGGSGGAFDNGGIFDDAGWTSGFSPPGYGQGKGRGKGGGQKPCFVCGKSGHIARNCRFNTGGGKGGVPRAPRGDPTGKTCFKCHQVGHYQANCPNAATPTGGGAGAGAGGPIAPLP